MSESDFQQLETAKLEWRQGDVPAASDFGDVYFCSKDGLNESRYVFLENNQLEQRWRELNANEVFCIGETGFGTGLNFLAAWQLWKQTAPESARLHFISAEKHPLKPDDLTRALAIWPELQPLAKQLVEQYPLTITGQHQLQFDDGHVTLQLLFDDAQVGFEQLRCSNHPQWRDRNHPPINAWFLDGFTPARNPELWNINLYALIADLSETGTTLSTFTAASAVRDSVAEQLE